MISVIVPVYNVEAYLNRCVDSILAQSYGDFELILVDDGSTDGSPAICDEYREWDKRVRVIHKPNGGSNSARNMGIFAAEGEYICLVDSDDTVERDYLETIADAVDKDHPDLITFGHYSVKNESKHSDRMILQAGNYDKARLEKEVFPRQICISKGIFEGSLILEVPWNKAYKRELIIEHCCKNSAIKVSNDLAFAHECVLFADSMTVIDKSLYNYYVGVEGSLQNSYHPDLIQNYKTLYLYLKERLSGLYPYIDDQLNVLLLAMTKKAFRQELIFGYSLIAGRRHLKAQFEESEILREIKMKGLSRRYKIRLLFLRMHMFGTVIVLQKALDTIREWRESRV